ncbi:hypothetical protein BY996DRAFT_6449766 [Phakopsora pachyrhizi]|nr:hypothetical protein BY996DRAFT_6449766 [Phakopsora pachyrhizi]
MGILAGLGPGAGRAGRGLDWAGLGTGTGRQVGKPGAGLLLLVIYWVGRARFGWAGQVWLGYREALFGT